MIVIITMFNKWLSLRPQDGIYIAGVWGFGTRDTRDDWDFCRWQRITEALSVRAYRNDTTRFIGMYVL